ncbi:glycosyltransferase [Desulforhopalus sp. IMCC35007]|uniref:glycosyltransferase n=1 Tax=Desulforhopalus sp. IMCC35007 TaxID=2569543 RepID=UPI0010AE7B2A|nr:glycosyltransferase [Desulforhopalus sp. IMCC35007]TKB09918.1 glycosyltransferase [Desulforhopalus sp. IMCC35007]
MKIITHFFKTFFPYTQGGLEEAIRQIGKYSNACGFETRVVCQAHENSYSVVDGIHAYAFKSCFGHESAPFSLQLIKEYKKFIQETDIIQIHYPSTCDELYFSLIGLKKPVVITFHCAINKWNVLRKIYEPFAKRLFSKATVIVPTSQNLLDSSLILQNYREKCEVINLWIDESRFQGGDEIDNEFIAKVNGLKRYTLFIGVLRWYKGLHVLLDASKSINGSILIVGEGPMFDELAVRIKKENLVNVHLLGFQPECNLKYLIQNSSCLVLPSVSPSEAFGQVLLESSFYGKPMVSTELGTGTSFVNLNNVTGYVVSPNDSYGLHSKINSLFANKNLREEFGKNARKRLQSNFTAHIQGQRYVDLYNRLLNS